MAEKKLTIRMNADTARLQAGMKTASASTRGFGKSVEQGITRHAAGIRRTGMALAGLGAAMTGMAVISIKAAADFGAQLAQVSTMLDETSMELMPQYSDQLRKMSKQFGESTKTLSDGLYDILSASIEPTKALGVLEVAATAAAAGITDTGTAADAITTILNAYQLQASEAASVSDWLFAVVKRGKTTFAELAPAIGKVATVANMAGVSMEELGAMVATLTRSGVATDRAMTAILGTLRAFLKASDESAETAEIFGVAMNTATLRTEGLRGVMLKLIDAESEQLAQIFPNIRGLLGFSAALGDAEGYAEDLNLMLNRGGLTLQAFDKITATVQHAFKQLKQEFADVTRALGLELIPIIKKDFIPLIKDIAKRLMEWVKRFGELSPSMKKFLLLLGPILIALGGLLMILPGLAVAIGLLLSPIGLVVAAIAAAVAAFIYFYKTNEKFRDYIDKSIAGWVLIGKVISAFVKGPATSLWKWAVFLYKNWPEVFMNLGQAIITIFDNIGKYIGKWVGWLGQKLNPKNWLKKIEKPEWGGFLEGFESTMEEFPKIVGMNIGEAVAEYKARIKEIEETTATGMKKITDEVKKSTGEIGTAWQDMWLGAEQDKLRYMKRSKKADKELDDAHQEMLRREDEAWSRQRKAREKAVDDFVNAVIESHEEMLERQDEASRKQRKDREKANDDFIDVVVESHEEMLKRQDEATRKHRREREKALNVFVDVWVASHEEMLDRQDEASRKQREARKKANVAFIDVVVQAHEEMLDRQDEASRRQREKRKKANDTFIDVVVEAHKEMLDRQDEASRKAREKRKKANEAFIDVVVESHEEMLERQDEATRKQREARKKANDAYIDVVVEGHEEMLERQDEASRKAREEREKANDAFMDVLVESHEEMLERQDEATQNNRKERETANDAFIDVVVESHKEMLDRQDEATRKNREKRKTANDAFIDVMVQDHEEMLERQDTATRKAREEREKANDAFIDVMVQDHEEMLDRQDQISRGHRQEQERASDVMVEVMIADTEEMLRRQQIMYERERREREREEKKSWEEIWRDAERAGMEYWERTGQLLDDYVIDVDEAAKRMKAIWEGFTSSVRSSFSDFFYDIISGTQDLDDAWTALANSIKEKFIRALADSLAEKMGWDKIFEGNILNLGNLFGGLGDIVKNTFAGIGKVIASIFGGGGEAAAGAAGGLGGLTGVLASLTSAISTAATVFGTLYVAMEGIKFAAENIVGPALSGIREGITDLLGLEQVSVGGIQTMDEFAEHFEIVGTRMEEAMQKGGETIDWLIEKGRQYTDEQMFQADISKMTFEEAYDYIQDQAAEAMDMMSESQRENFERTLVGLDKQKKKYDIAYDAMLENAKTLAAGRYEIEGQTTAQLIEFYAQAIVANENMTDTQKRNILEVLGVTEEAAEDMMRAMGESTQDMADSMDQATSDMTDDMNEIPRRIDFSVIGEYHLPDPPEIPDLWFWLRGRWWIPEQPEGYQHGGQIEPGELVFSKPITDWIRAALSGGNRPMGYTPSIGQPGAGVPTRNIIVNVPRGAFVVYGDIRTKADVEELEERLMTRGAEEIAARVAEAD